jgi:hypothetical protein
MAASFWLQFAGSFIKGEFFESFLTREFINQTIRIDHSASESTTLPSNVPSK